MFKEYGFIINGKNCILYEKNGFFYCNDELTNQEVQVLKTFFGGNRYFIGDNGFIKRLNRACVVFNVFVALVYFVPEVYKEIPESYKVYTEYYLAQATEYSDYSEEFSSDKIVDCLNRNPYLSEAEKEFVLGRIEYIELNKKYINFDKLYRNLLELQFNYIPLSEQTGEEYCLGYFSKLENKITILETPEFLSTNINNSSLNVVSHEFDHFLANTKSLLEINYNINFNYYYPIILESMLQYNSNSYLNFQSDEKVPSVGYNSIVDISVVLSKIVSEDAYKYSLFSESAYPIVAELSSLVNDSEYVFDFFNTINKFYDLLNKLYDEPFTEEDYSEYYALGEQIYQGLEVFYNAKYDTEFTDDYDCMIAIYNTGYNFNPNREKMGEIIRDNIYSLDKVNRNLYSDNEAYLFNSVTHEIFTAARLKSLINEEYKLIKE